MKLTRQCVDAVAVLLILAAYPVWGAEKFSASGFVLKVNPAERRLLVSCQEIPGHMEAMVMPLAVRDSKALLGVLPGMNIEFSLVTDKDQSYAENIVVRPFQSLELDPTQARRLKLMEKITSPGGRTDFLTQGQPVPDFTLTDQARQPVHLSQFGGKVVALTFIYTRCPFPDYCFRLSNNFGLLQKRFRDRLGSDLVLLSVVIDPAHDQPEALANYARIWKAEPRAWHFLTGSQEQIEQIARRFDMTFYPDEALYVHSFHTIVIDRKGRLAANVEGNDFTPKQLADLVATVMSDPN